MMNRIFVSKNQLSGDKGESFVSYQLSRNNIIVQPIFKDFGEDLLCEIVLENIRTVFSFRIQVKSSEEISKYGYIRNAQNGVSVSIDTSHLVSWKNSFYPVILVCVDLTSETGWWCVPVDEFEDIPNTQTATVHLQNTFDDRGIDEIKSYVINYYKHIYRMNHAKYKCTIYPFWMPLYRNMTSMEIMELFNINYEDIESKLVEHYADMLPTFLSSYPNINWNGCISGINFLLEAKNVEDFIEYIIKKLMPLSNDSDKEWISFVMSPIELIEIGTDTTISNITYWDAYSLINNTFVNDFQYTFQCPDSFVYSQPVRATSSDHDFFMKENGKFAVEIYTSGYGFTSRNHRAKLHNQLFDKCYHIIDISGLSDSDFKELQRWIKKYHYAFSKIQGEENYIVLSHPSFLIGAYGTLLPGILTWNQWDELLSKSKNIINNLPYGKVVDKDIRDILSKESHGLRERDDFEEYSLTYSTATTPELLRHDKRCISFISFIKTIDGFQTAFNLCKQEIKTEVSKHVNHVDMLYEPIDDIGEITITITPTIDISTEDVVRQYEHFFLKLLDRLNDYIDNSFNTAYIIKYKLDRYLPEEMVIKSD